MFVQISLDYNTRLTAEQIDQLAAIANTTPDYVIGYYHKSEPDEKGTRQVDTGPYTVVLDDIVSWGKATGIPFKIVPGDVAPGLVQRMIASLQQMNARLSVIETHVNDYGDVRSQAFNERVSVHVPGNAMLDIKTTMVMENACTDQLRRYLQQGWQIVAVCPQPDQRRPDYVLGHRNPDAEY